ncbi:hypothetical protein DFR50_1597 [Roseiarcus fermentans]|uniref:Uncharacterized protein n=1 Tax=Roseiarcus fermentans TaxID=1473586 RepID=A0A366EF94_9HYPH|nr:hypothetical protein [Roseiarcus fermentans]RBP01062.1 hypothetical protein DFR50_1597 [Roseiarcus fermentans]
MSPPRIIRDFRTVIELCARGRLTERLDQKLADCLEALNASPDEKAKASLTVTLELQRAGDRIEIRPKATVKLPEEKGVGSTTLFAAEGGLSLQHPSQTDMFSGPRDAASPTKRDAAS